jgi:hypothetical protein
MYEGDSARPRENLEWVHKYQAINAMLYDEEVSDWCLGLRKLVPIDLFGHFVK